MSLKEIDEIDELNELTSIFDGNSLYVVGGSVRNAIIGLPLGDIDIAAELHIETVKRLLRNSHFCIVAEYPRTGTLVIKKGNFKAEYTTFREDSYAADKGCHMPERVVFTSDIIKDAKRRDFTINAVYYDIASKVIIDPLNGMRDIADKILKTVDNPDKVMGQDALRLLRLIRFSAELGFAIESKTYESLAKYAPRITEIVRERITDELIKTLSAEWKYPRFSRGNYNKTLLRNLIEYQKNGLLTAVLGIDKIDENVNKIDSKHGLVERLAAIYCSFENYSLIMKSIKLPNHLIKATDAVINAFRADKNDIADYIINHIDGYYGAKSLMQSSVINAIDNVISSGVPLRISELKINGHDAKKLGFECKQIAAALKYVLKRSIQLGLLTREKQMEELKNYEANYITHRNYFSDLDC